MASSHIPFVTQEGIGSRFEGKLAFDGGLTDNMPLPPPPERPRKLLAFRLREVTYALGAVLSPSDPCIEGLVLTGAMQMRRFLRMQERISAESHGGGTQGENVGEDGQKVAGIRWYAPLRPTVSGLRKPAWWLQMRWVLGLAALVSACYGTGVVWATIGRWLWRKLLGVVAMLLARPAYGRRRQAT